MSTARLVGGLKGRSELGVAGLLLALGGVVLWDTAQMSTNFAQRGPIGPKAMPSAVGLMLVACAVLLARDVLRGGHGEEESGEDIDLTHGSDWRTVLLLGGAFLANVALIERTGWVISGAVLFWGAAHALGSRHVGRDALVAVGLSTVTFYVFSEGLGIHLPAGWLQGVL